METRLTYLEKIIETQRPEEAEIEEPRRELARPAERTPEQVAKALSIVGIGEGRRIWLGTSGGTFTAAKRGQGSIC